jgi:hypothetical protein
MTVDIPDELIPTLSCPAMTPPATLERPGREACRQRRISAFQLRRLLPFPKLRNGREIVLKIFFGAVGIHRQKSVYEIFMKYIFVHCRY